MSSFGTLAFHRMLVSDRARMEAYRAAMARVVRPGDVVLDIGAGTGVLALFACQAGAKQVFAVERTPVAQLARQLVSANGLSDRVDVLEMDIRQVELRERVDVVVSELVSKAVLGQHLPELMTLARERFLKEGGRIVPEEVELLLAPVEATDEYRALTFPDRDQWAIDFTPVQRLSLSEPTSARIAPSSLLADPGVALRLVLRSSTARLRIDVSLRFHVQRSAQLHGFAAWFRATLAAGIVLSTEPPGLPSWDNVLFPLPTPVSVAAGDEVTLRLRCDVPPDDDPIWRWSTEVRSGARILGQFDQSSFDAILVPARGGSPP